MFSCTDDEALRLKHTAIMDSLCEIASAYHAHGKSSAAMQVLTSALHLAEIGEARKLRLKLLLVQGKVLVFEYVYTNAGYDLMFSSLLEAKQLAEEANDRQAIAAALGFLGMAHYFVELNGSTSIVSSSASYDEALTCQNQALELRETLGDTRGVSESTFLIGTVYERRNQNQLAMECYTKAFQIADKWNHIYEKTEPSRHFAYHSLQKGDFDKALKHTQQASFLADEMGYKRAIVSSLLSLGDIMAAELKKDEAIANYKYALQLAEDLRIPLVIARTKEHLERVAAL